MRQAIECLPSDGFSSPTLPLWTRGFFGGRVWRVCFVAPGWN